MLSKVSHFTNIRDNNDNNNKNNNNNNNNNNLAISSLLLLKKKDLVLLLLNLMFVFKGNPSKHRKTIFVSTLFSTSVSCYFVAGFTYF